MPNNMHPPGNMGPGGFFNHPQPPMSMMGPSSGPMPPMFTGAPMGGGPPMGGGMHGMPPNMPPMPFGGPMGGGMNPPLPMAPMPGMFCINYMLNAAFRSLKR